MFSDGAFATGSSAPEISFIQCRSSFAAVAIGSAASALMTISAAGLPASVTVNAPADNVISIKALVRIGFIMSFLRYKNVSHLYS